MTEPDFVVWKERAVVEYAADKVRAGNDMEDGAVERSRKDFERFLPNGLSSEGHYLFSIVDDETKAKVGILWLGSIQEAPDMIWVYDIEIDQKQRGKGYGTAALKLAEEKARELGKKRIGLQVFGHNKDALRLYERLGYKATNIAMAKLV